MRILLIFQWHGTNGRTARPTCWSKQWASTAWPVRRVTSSTTSTLTRTTASSVPPICSPSAWTHLALYSSRQSPQWLVEIHSGTWMNLMTNRNQTQFFSIVPPCRKIFFSPKFVVFTQNETINKIYKSKRSSFSFYVKKIKTRLKIEKNRTQIFLTRVAHRHQVRF